MNVILKDLGLLLSERLGVCGVKTWRRSYLCGHHTTLDKFVQENWSESVGLVWRPCPEMGQMDRDELGSSVQNPE